MQQRFDTILRVAQAIVERQRRFFEHGEVAMRPMVLREIADMLTLHESTISRVTTQKYMLTPRGTFELKYFFGSHVATDTGGAASATAIRALIKQLVGAEEPQGAADRQPDRRHPRRAGHPRRAPHHRQVPRGAGRFRRSTCARRSEVHCLAPRRRSPLRSCGDQQFNTEERSMNLNLTGITWKSRPRSAPMSSASSIA